MYYVQIERFIKKNKKLQNINCLLGLLSFGLRKLRHLQMYVILCIWEQICADLIIFPILQLL